MVRFFGHPGDESRLVSLDVTGLGVKYDGKAVRSELAPDVRPLMG